jgi:hypothetical protein
MCNTGNGIGAGKNAFRARCNKTLESLPIEYIITGRENEAAVSLNISILSASSDLS